MSNKIKGGHYIIDFFGCDPHQINKLDFWKKELPLAVKEAGMDILHSHFHQFDPQGITGFLLLSSSHLSIHTWPEYNYVACDVFSCSHGDETKMAVDYLTKKIDHKRTERHYVKRGYVTIDYLATPIYATGKIKHIKIDSKLAEIDSAFQNILVVDTTNFGRCLVIDKVIQTSVSDHHVYDESLLEKLSKDTKDILILGGGDGYVAETALKICPNAHISIIELDQEVVDCAQRYLGQKVFNNPNVKLIIGDAVNFLKIQQEKGVCYDLVISDLTDNPIGGNGRMVDTKNLYNQIIDLSHKVLKKGGWISIQGGASKVNRKYLDITKIIVPIIQKRFNNVERRDIMIPSFGEDCAFLFGQKNN